MPGPNKKTLSLSAVSRVVGSVGACAISRQVAVSAGGDRVIGDN